MKELMELQNKIREHRNAAWQLYVDFKKMEIIPKEKYWEGVYFAYGEVIKNIQELLDNANKL